MQHTKIIEGVSYTTTTLPATRGLLILPRLIALFGEPILKLIFTTSQELGEGDDAGEAMGELLQDPKVMATILHGMAANAAEDNGLLVIKDLMMSTEADKARMGEAEVQGNVHQHFDTHFAARYTHLAQVAMWVASCNFIGP